MSPDILFPAIMIVLVILCATLGLTLAMKYMRGQNHRSTFLLYWIVGSMFPVLFLATVLASPILTGKRFCDLPSVQHGQ